MATAEKVTNFLTGPAMYNAGRGANPVRIAKAAGSGFHGMFGTGTGIAATALIYGMTDVSMGQLAFESTAGWSMMTTGGYMGAAAGRLAGRGAMSAVTGVGRIAGISGGARAKRRGALYAKMAVGKGYNVVEKQLVKRGIETAGFRKAIGVGKGGATATARIGATIGSAILPVAGTAVGAVAGFVAGAMLSTAIYDTMVSAPRKMMEYGRKLRTLETGKGFHDPFGTAYTMRQRSLREMQRSHINARSALGGESFYNHIR